MKTGQINLKQFLIGLEVTPSYEGLLKGMVTTTSCSSSSRANDLHPAGQVTAWLEPWLQPRTRSFSRRLLSRPTLPPPTSSAPSFPFGGLPPSPLEESATLAKTRNSSILAPQKMLRLKGHPREHYHNIWIPNSANNEDRSALGQSIIFLTKYGV